MNKSIKEIRGDFPILFERVSERPLVYLDNAATTHRPQSVINALQDYYKKKNANPHRGAHKLSILSTEAYESTREKVKNFINAKDMKEIIFTKNATEAFNLLAYSYGMNFISEGDEIVISIAEHHSNLIPWQQVARAKKATLKYLYVDEEGRIPAKEIEEKITDKTKLVSIAHMTNTFGIINPIEKIIEYAHSKGAVVVIDGAQSVPHIKVDVQKLDADFLVFSGHKMMAPMGVGVLYGKEQLLEIMPPFLYGGDMIEYVSEQGATFAELPYKLEAGTQNVEAVVGLGAAIDYIEELGIENIAKRERALTAYALGKLEDIPYVKIHGPKDLSQRGGVISFSIEGVHPHDVASIVDTYGVALRAGHHCAQPFMKYMNINATSRISFYVYNTEEEIDIFIESIKNVRKWLGYEPK